jgi:NitT/TauT family transport system substrate-binding protein
MNQTRRTLLRAAGAVGLLSVPAPRALAEPPPETTTIRLVHDPAICIAPQYLAEELLRGEGFTRVEYVPFNNVDTDPYRLLAGKKSDLCLDAAPALVPAIDSPVPIVVLAGIHGGCYELFAKGPVKGIKDLKGKRIAITAVGAGEQVFIASMMAYVGMDPRKDAIWLEGHTQPETMALFVDGKADAFLGFPPQPQHLRAQKAGHVIVNTSQDRPWSQYFCCMVSGRRDFVRANPVATKRALRAILKATDICIREPERAARYLVDKGYERDYPVALEVLKDVSYRPWRSFDPEATLRFYALRLHEVGMIKSTPQKILAQGTDWRFLDEIKKELKT